MKLPYKEFPELLPARRRFPKEILADTLWGSRKWWGHWRCPNLFPKNCMSELFEANLKVVE